MSRGDSPVFEIGDCFVPIRRGHNFRSLNRLAARPKRTSPRRVRMSAMSSKSRQGTVFDRASDSGRRTNRRIPISGQPPV
jgi:hypothetical protein